ncbi:MAG: hypothetical protein L6R35_007122 [Caloplaca aegaea]|nr:MAG: hypothetical protein L6R35_007122 [Caloplaca aegaea]
MDTLIQSAYAPHQSIADAHASDGAQYPRNGWRAEDVKKCLGYTDDEYTDLYSKVEEAMRHADLIEVSLTGQRKTKLFAILDQVLPHENRPNVPDFLRIKALHQLAIRINHNVKTRSGHVHHRKRPNNKPRPAVRAAETRRPPPVPATVNRPNPPPPHTPQTESQVIAPGHYCGLGSMLLLAERDEHTQSTCSLKHIARNVKPGGPITVDNVSLEAWKSVLENDGVLHNPSDEVTITWKWGERRVKVPNDRVLRTVVEFMSTHGGFIDFSIESAGPGEQLQTSESPHKLISNPAQPD